MLEGLLVPYLSVPATSVPSWNIDNLLWLEAAFEFIDGYLHDDGALIIFYPLRAIVKATILKYNTTYSFDKMKDWWRMNWLHLASPISTSRTIYSLAISILGGVNCL